MENQNNDQFKEKYIEIINFLAKGSHSFSKNHARATHVYLNFNSGSVRGIVYFEYEERILDAEEFVKKAKENSLVVDDQPENFKQLNRFVSEGVRRLFSHLGESHQPYPPQLIVKYDSTDNSLKVETKEEVVDFELGKLKARNELQDEVYRRNGGLDLSNLGLRIG